jgi:hypothetical protein
MAQQIINTGAVANDGTGESLRDAFNAVNDNFSNIWAQGPVDSQVVITNNTVSTNQTNLDLVLSANGIGNVTVNSTLTPGIDSVYDLGSANAQFDTVWARYYQAGSGIFSGDVTVDGNLVVAGNIIQVGNIVTDSLTIQLGNTVTNAAGANGAGITVGANDNLATILYNSTSNVWKTNIGISANGNVTGNYIIGNGSQLTGLPASYSNSNVATYLASGNNTSNIVTTANISGNFFIGNGSQLTGINISSNKIFNGNSFANIATANGNVVVSSAGQNWTFDTTGVLNLPLSPNGQSNQIKYGMGNLVAWLDGQWTIGEYDSSTDTYGATGIRISPGIEGSAEVILPSNDTANVTPLQVNNYAGNVQIETGNGSTNRYWTFDGNGAITLPPDGYVQTANSYPTLLAYGSAGHGGPELDWANTSNLGNLNSTDVLRHTMYLNDEEGLYIGFNENGVANVASPSWAFTTDGNLNLPGRGKIENQANTSLDPLTPTASTMVLTPDGNYSYQALVLDPTAPGHIHLRSLPISAGNIDQPTANIFLGGELSSFEVGASYGDTPNVFIHSGGNTWTFSTDGNLNAPGNISVTGDMIGANVVANTNFVGTRLVTNLTDFNWSDPIVGITLGANTYVQLANNVFGDPWSGQVNISGVGGTSEANGIWYYLAVDSNQFELFSDANATPVNSSTWGAYTSGGIAYTLGYNNLEINAQNITIRSDHGDYNDKIWSFNSNGSTVFPVLSTQRGDNPSGTISGFTLNGSDGSQEFIITTPDGVVGNEYSQRLVINPGSGNNFGEGGDIYLWAGRGGDGSGSGGDIKIRGGQGGYNTQGGAGGDGGYIRMEAGDGATTGGAPGYIEITGGISHTAQGGYVRVTGGTGSTVGGDANIKGGYGAATGGNVNIWGGGSGNGQINEGHVNIQTGGNTWIYDSAGVLTLPGEGVIRSNNDVIQLQSWDTANSVAYGLRVGTSGGLYLEQGSNPAYLTIDSNAGDAQIYAASGQSGAAGKNLTIYAGSADEGSYNTSPGGNIYLQAGAGGFNDGGGGGPGGDVNLTSGASLDPAGHNGNVTINTGGANTWTFDYTGGLTLPTGGKLGYAGMGWTGLSSANGAPVELTSYTANGNTSTQVFLNSNGSLAIFASDEANATSYTWNFENTGNLAVPGTITTAGSGGNISGANVITANVFSASGNVTGNYFIGNGSLLTGISANYGNANVVANLAALGSNPVSTTGNITGGNLIATANVLGNGYAKFTGSFDESQAATAGLYLGYAGGTPRMMFGTGNTQQTFEIDNDGGTLRFYQPGSTKASLYSDGAFSAAGNVSGSNLFATGVVSAAGNVRGGNINTAGMISAAGNVTAANFIGNISITGNVTGTSANVTLVAGSYNYTFDNTGILTLPAPATGNEGSEIDFTKAANSTLSGNIVAIDQYVDRIRIFEGGGTSRGAYIDLSQAAAGVGTLLNNRVSGLVNAGTYVTMDLLKATVTTSGNRGLSLAATTGSFNILIGATFAIGSSSAAGGSAGSGTINTSASTSQFGWNFTAAGDISTYTITDTTNSRAYRITLQIGASYNNNLISIERLV